MRWLCAACLYLVVSGGVLRYRNVGFAWWWLSSVAYRIMAYMRLSFQTDFEEELYNWLEGGGLRGHRMAKIQTTDP